MVGMEFFYVTIATDDHNEDSVSVEPRQGIVVVNNGSTSCPAAEDLSWRAWRPSWS